MRKRIYEDNDNFHPEPIGYASETLTNGNISHCIDYISNLFRYGYIRIGVKEIAIIRDNNPDRYDYILNRIKHF